MSEAAAPAPAAPAAAPAAPAAAPIASPSPGRQTPEDRAQALISRLQSEGDSPSEAGGEAEEQPSSPQDGPGASAPASAGEPPTPDARAQASADRLARINAVRQREAADKAKRQQEQARRQQDKQQTSEVEGMRKRLAELEPLANIPKSEEALLGWAEQNGMTVEKLVQYMRQRLQDPQAIAQRQVKTEADALREEMRQQREEFEAYKQSVAQRENEAREQYHSQQRAQHFLNTAHQSTESHPLTNAFLGRYGPQGLIAYANQFVAPLLPEGYEVSELHDHVEQLLQETQLSAPAGRAPAQPAAPPTARNGAGQPVTTLGNAVAAERSSVAEDIPLHKRFKSADERAEYLKGIYQREQ